MAREVERDDGRVPIVILPLAICPSERARGRNKYLCLFVGHPPHKRREFRTGTHSLRSSYARLEECANNVLRIMGRYDMVTHAGTSFYRFFLRDVWRNAPRLVKFEAYGDGGGGHWGCEETEEEQPLYTQGLEMGWVEIDRKHISGGCSRSGGGVQHPPIYLYPLRDCPS